MKELELRRANSKGWAVVGRTSIEQEETAEVIVPDAQPDIWQVWDASTCLLLQRKEVTVQVLPTHDKWFGVTYAADKAAVTESFAQLIAQGVYGEDLYADL